MLSSTELIAAFDECEKRIGKEKATPFNMFCEGFFLRELVENESISQLTGSAKGASNANDN